jgi:nucleoside-diphosphate-sugar epimerase
MRVFVTGATGWVGTAVVEELLSGGHHVLGLARSKEKGERLAAGGAEVLLATLDDLAALRTAAEEADAVVHLAFNHDFSRFAENAAQDRRAIEALGEALAGSDKPFLVTSGVALIAPGRVAVETDRPSRDASFPRRSEVTAAALAECGLRAATVRLAPSVHGVGETHGFVPMLIDLARRSGVSAYIGEGENRWAAVHVSDAGRLYRLALEGGVAQPVYHATHEEGIAFRDIAEAIGRKLGLPVARRDREHFGWFADFASADMQASNRLTREALGWRPTGPALLADIADPGYYAG